MGLHERIETCEGIVVSRVGKVVTVFQQGTKIRLFFFNELKSAEKAFTEWEVLCKTGLFSRMAV